MIHGGSFGTIARTALVLWVNKTTAQSIPNDTITNVIDWNDPLGGPGGNSDPIMAAAFNAATGVFTVPLDGRYLLTSEVDFAPNVAGYRQSDFFPWGSQERFDPVQTAFDTEIGTGHVSGLSTVGNQFILKVRQTSGGALNVTFGQIGIAYLG